MFLLCLAPFQDIVAGIKHFKDFIKSIDFEKDIKSVNDYVEKVAKEVNPSMAILKLIQGTSQTEANEKASEALKVIQDNRSFGEGVFERAVHDLAVKDGVADLAYLPETFTDDLNKVVVFDKQPFSAHCYSKQSKMAGKWRGKSMNTDDHDLLVAAGISVPEEGRRPGQPVARLAIILGCCFKETCGRYWLDRKSKLFEKFFKRKN